MAKKQAFGSEALQQKAAHRKMAKVIISTKVGNGKYAFRESMVDQENVQQFITEKKA